VKLRGKNTISFVPYPEDYGVILLCKTHSRVHVKSVMDWQGDTTSMFPSSQSITAFKLPTKKMSQANKRKYLRCETHSVKQQE